MGMKLDNHYHLAPKCRMCEAVPPHKLCIRGVAHNLRNNFAPVKLELATL